MSMKRLAMVLTVLLAASAMIFAAGQSDAKAATSAKPVVVKCMAYGDNSNEEGRNWIRIVEAFEKANPGIVIQYELLYDEAYHQKVTARLAAGDIPHFAYMGADARWGKPWQDAGQQFDHRPYLDPNYYEMDLIPPMGPNGEIYEIPLGTSNICTVLYANEPLIKSLGFSLPKTFQDIIAMVPAAKKAGLEVISIDGADGWAWGSCFMSSVIARLSGDPNWVSKAVAGTYKFTDEVFVRSLEVIPQMVAAGVISPQSVTVDYGTNVSNYSNKKALFMIQGQWIAGEIDPAVADDTVMMAFPALPGEKASTAGSVAAAIQVGYGLTKAGAADPVIRDAALKFISYFYSHEETAQRLLDGAIVAAVLKNFQVPEELPKISKSKVILAQTAMNTDVIDAFLSGAANDNLNAGMQKLVIGGTTARALAEEVEALTRK